MPQGGHHWVHTPVGELGVRFDIPVQTGPKAHQPFFKMGTGSVS